jgi:biotin carboxylase
MEIAPVLVTNGWLRIAYNVVESLARRGIPVHVVDSSKLAMCRTSRWTRSFHRVPDHYTDPEGFVRSVADVAVEVGAAVLIPVHEEILPLAVHRDRLPADLRMALTSADNLSLCLDKWETVERCRQVGAPAPASFIPASLDDLCDRAARLAYPVVIKTRAGNSGKGVGIVHGADELPRRYAELLEQYEIGGDRWPIVQEYLGEDLHGVCMIYEHGTLRASFCEQYTRCKEEGMFGTSTYRVATRKPRHVESCKRVADSLQWHGVIHFDLLVDPKTGEGKIIEINPRFWGALNLAVASGVDFPFLLYELALTGAISDPPQSYRENVTSRWIVGDMIAFANALLGKSNMRAKLRRMAEIAATPLGGSSDDFRPTDPAPFLFEAIDYASRYLSSGSRNPVVKGMVR